MAKKAKTPRKAAANKSVPKATRVSRSTAPRAPARSLDPAAPRAASARPAASSAMAAPDIEVQKTVRQVHLAFSRDVPADMVRAGMFDVGGQRAAAAAAIPQYGPNAKDVPDGKYRVEGADYIYTFKGGELVMAERARPDTDPADIVPVPTAETIAAGNNNG